MGRSRLPVVGDEIGEAVLETDGNPKTTVTPDEAAAEVAVEVAQAAAEEVNMAGVPVAAEASTDLAAWVEHLATAEQWPGQADVLAAAAAMHAGTGVVLAVAGVIYLLFGYAIYRYLLMLNAFAVGGVIGLAVGAELGQPWGGAAVGGLLLAALSWPLARHAVAVLGGGIGFVIGLCAWNLLGLDESYCVAGGLIGGVFLGMLTLSLFKVSVMLLMSVQGAAMFVAGVLGMLFQFEGVGASVRESLAGRSVVLPIVLLLPVLVGLVFQTAPAAEPAKKK